MAEEGGDKRDWFATHKWLISWRLYTSIVTTLTTVHVAAALLVHFDRASSHPAGRSAVEIRMYENEYCMANQRSITISSAATYLTATLLSTLLLFNGRDAFYVRYEIFVALMVMVVALSQVSCPSACSAAVARRSVLTVLLW